MVSEARMVKILADAQEEWDRIHGDGFNEAYLSLCPTLYHLQAKRIHEALHQAATGVPLAPA